MKQSNIRLQSFLLLLSLLLSLTLLGQFKSGQRLINVDLSTAYSHQYGEDPFKSNNQGFFANKYNDSKAQLAVSVGLDRLTNNTMIKGHSFGLTYADDRRLNSVIDTLFINNRNILYTYFRYSLNYGLSFTRLFPIKPKWGAFISEANKINVFIINDHSRNDSADYVFFDNVTQGAQLQISAGLLAGLYCWVHPRLILSTSINLFDIKYSASFRANGYPDQNLLFESTFSNGYNPAFLRVKFQFLLK